MAPSYAVFAGGMGAFVQYDPACRGLTFFDIFLLGHLNKILSCTFCNNIVKYQMGMGKWV